MKRNRLPIWVIAATGAAILFLGDIAIELLMDDLKNKVQPYRYVFWGLLILAFLTAVIGAIAGAKSKQPADLPDTILNKFDINDRKRLIDAFLNCSAMNTKEKRSLIAAQLPVEIKHRIGSHPGNIGDVESIVATAMEFDGGMNKLLEVIAYFEGETRNIRNLREVVDEVVNGSKVQVKFDLPPIESTVSGPKKIIRDSNSTVLDKLTRSGDSDRGA
ncbi:MAG: hypothetical protein IPM66_09045 [Acidobacteriota bacterium]|nr:MAG: hypothetical protein IPM66_09045 [Acidobacteriota bacterium]